MHAHNINNTDSQQFDVKIVQFIHEKYGKKLSKS